MGAAGSLASRSFPAFSGAAGLRIKACTELGPGLATGTAHPAALPEVRQRPFMASKVPPGPPATGGWNG